MLQIKTFCQFNSWAMDMEGTIIICICTLLVLCYQPVQMLKINNKYHSLKKKGKERKKEKET